MSLVAALVVGCSEDDSAPSTPAGQGEPSADADATSGGDAESTEDTTPGDDDASTDEDGTPAEEVAESFDALAAVPPSLLEGDLTSCAAGFESGDLTSGQHDGYEVSGQSRSFVVQFPDGGTYEGPRPLMVLFNGTGGTGQGAFNDYGGQELVDGGWIVLAPDSNGNGTIWPSWDGMLRVGEEDHANPDMDFFDSLVACLAGQADVDANRVYVSGHSAGGIMSNFVLQRRSNLLAGGIVASGLFDLTQSVPDITIEPMFVVVTWGGDNVGYSGASENDDVAVPDVNFTEQAGIASVFWEEQAEGDQVHCRGDDLGHEWVSGAQSLMFEALLKHPKGLAKHTDWGIDDGPAVADSACSEDAFVYVPPVVSECGEATIAECKAYCQLLADCVVENATVAPVLGPGLTSIGFAGDDFSDCAGCITNCEADAATADDQEAAILACFDTAAGSAECGAGINGALPAITAINECCIDAPESPVCTRVCEAVLLVSVATPFFEEGCAAWMTPVPDEDGDE